MGGLVRALDSSIANGFKDLTRTIETALAHLMGSIDGKKGSSLRDVNDQIAISNNWLKLIFEKPT